MGHEERPPGASFEEIARRERERLGLRDEPKMAKLARELQALPAPIAVAQLTGGKVGHRDGGQSKFDASLTTGFFYGDAIRFYALTWDAGLLRDHPKQK